MLIARYRKVKQNFVWTVEWYDETKRRVLTQTSSTARIQDADPFHQHETQHKGKKRKLGAERPSQTAQSQSQLPSDITSTQLQHGEHPAENQDKPLERLEVDHQLEINNQKPEHLPSRPRAPSDVKGKEVQTAQGQAHLATTHPGDPSNDGSNSEPVGNGQHRFFLLRPRTSSSRQVLIPLDPSRTLGENLYNRTVLEFPTIYVFTGLNEQVPEEFMLEEEYIKQEGEEQKEFDELIQDLDPEILRRLRDHGSTRDGAREEEVDAKKILDVLKQDLGGAL
jgi:hypothetical protein